ncbi:MAG TPA: spermidine synthase-like protein, partial [Deltaproteobacteria bacterium]|nr:spermidine synthase-like protein [Deltaproteobacteria bacterium]
MRPSLVLESPFAEDSSTLRFFEPPDIDRFSLWMRVCAGAYDKPFVLDTGPERFLQFDLDAVQSAMRADDPDRLTLAYTRKMMSFLLFKPSPARILLLGLGGGSLAKFCHRRLPGSVMTAVEISGDVIALREEFSVPADDVRFRVVHSDAAAYVAQASPCKDVILSDACDRRGIAPQLDCLEFYANARRCLRPGGIFVINLCGDPCSRGAHLLRLRQVFGDEIFTLQVRRNDNAIALAFNGRRPKLHPGRRPLKA